MPGSLGNVHISIAQCCWKCTILYYIHTIFGKISVNYVPFFQCFYLLILETFYIFLISIFVKSVNILLSLSFQPHTQNFAKTVIESINVSSFLCRYETQVEIFLSGHLLQPDLLEELNFPSSYFCIFVKTHWDEFSGFT